MSRFACLAVGAVFVYGTAAAMDAPQGASAGLDQSQIEQLTDNHFLWDSPRVMFMHIGGTGEQVKLAAAVGRVFAAIKETSGGAGAALAPAAIGPSQTTTHMHGHQVGAAMGVNTWAAFIGSDDRAVVDGDFAMLEPDLQGVLKALRHAGLNVVAIHNHMVGEEPRVLFLHFWGVGSSEGLAKGLKDALGATRR
jgi:hypothetical protein